MGRCGGLDHLHGLEPKMLTAWVFEHPRAAEQQGHKVDRDFVDQSCPDVLLPDLGASHHGDILLPGGRRRPGVPRGERWRR